MKGQELCVGTAQEIVAFLWSLRNLPKDGKYVLSDYREKRSLNSNNYFHTLAGQLRFKIERVPWSMAHIKNYLITTYGQEERDEQGKGLYIKANIPPEKAQEMEEPHLHFIKCDPENKDAYFYQLYRGSHTYNSKEMADLIAGTVDECQRVGIPTATPAELAQMAAAWESAYARKN